MKGKCKHFDSASNLSILPDYYLALAQVKSRGVSSANVVASLKGLFKPYLNSSFDNINLVTVGSQAPPLDLGEFDFFDNCSLAAVSSRFIPRLVHLICDELVSYILFLRKGSLVTSLQKKGTTERIPGFRLAFKACGSDPLAVLTKGFWLALPSVEQRVSSAHSSLSSVFISLLTSPTWSRTPAVLQCNQFLTSSGLTLASPVFLTALSDYINTLPQPTAFLVPHKRDRFLLDKVYYF